MSVERRRLLSVLGTTAVTGLVGCTSGDSTAPRTESPTPSETGTIGTGSAPSRELTIVSRADSDVSFDQQLVQQSSESTVYRESHTYTPGDRVVLRDPFERDETYEFAMRTPEGETVFERNLYPYIVRLEVTIRSGTDVEQTGIVEI